MSYKIEMHAHTAQSSPCSELYADELISRYADAGYAAVTITDHLRLGYTVSAQDAASVQLQKFLTGYEAALCAGKRYGVKIYLGAELYFLQTPQLEFLVYGATEDFLYKSLAYLSGSIEDFYPFARENGVLVFCAHPFRYTDCPPDPAFVDGAEVYNAHPGQNSRNELGLQYALDNGLMQVSGSDAHHPTHVARGGILADTLPEDAVELRQLLLSGNYTLLRSES